MKIIYKQGIGVNMINMKVFQRQHCNGCRALQKSWCKFGVPIVPKIVDNMIFGFIPKKPCPKPKTHGVYFEAVKTKWRHKK